MKAETFQSSPSPLCLPISNHDEPLKLESIIGLRDERSLTVPTVESLTKRQASLPSMSSQRSAPRCRSSPPTTACHKRCSSLLYLLLLLALVHCASCRGPKVNATYQRTPYIRSKVKLDVPTFRGEGVRYTVNETLNFVGTTMLSRWGETENIILVGSSNGVYMLEADQISEPNVLYSERLQFPPETEIYNECVETHSRQIKRCKNYIKEMFLDNEGQLRVCGTHAMSKQCRFYQRSTFDVSEDRVQSVFTKKEFCFQNNDKTNPCSDPFKETVSIQVADPNSEKPQYFSAIHKRDSGPMFSSTEATTYKSWFSYPTFVKILEYGKKVYVFFRESAENSEVGPRDTQTKYARVAQACKDDGNINSIWSTFRKARLFCNVQQAMTDTALVYDVLQSVSDIHQVVLNPGEDPTAVVFATFTTPNTWFGMKPSSAVCMYTIEEIDRVFEGSKFFADSSDNGYRKFPVDPPLRIENCDYSGREDEIKRNSPFFEFLEQHSSLVVDEVRPKYDRAIFVSPDDTKVTAIAVNKVGDSEVVVYLGTSKGTVLRILPFTSRNFAMFLEEMDFVGNKECGDGGEYSDFCRVKAIEIIPQNVSGPANLLVAFEDEVKFSSCATCTLHFTRIMCENDPECMFVSSENKCQPIIAQSRATSESVDKIDQSETHPGQEVSPPHMISRLLTNLEPSLSRNILKLSTYTFNDKQKCLAGLEAALTETFHHVMENYHAGAPLPYMAFTRFAHVMPLLIHHVNYWKSKVKEQMRCRDRDAHCVNRRKSSTRKKKSCTRRAKFKSPLAMELWVELVKLMHTEYSSVQCNGTSPGNECPEGEYNEKALSTKCYPTNCSYFSKESVVSLFRLPQNYLVNDTCLFPLRKADKCADQSNSDCSMQLEVSKKKRFLMKYDTATEMISFKFKYSIKSESKTDKTEDEQLQYDLDLLLRKVYNAVRYKQYCAREPNRHKKRRRSAETAERQNAVTPHCLHGSKCKHYCIDAAELEFLWEDYTNRLRLRGIQGSSQDNLNGDIIDFRSESNAERYFENKCNSIKVLQRKIKTPENQSSHAQRGPKPRSNKDDVRIVVGRTTPFELIRDATKQKTIVKVKFYAEVDEEQ